MRRLIIVEPVARASLWCRRLAVFGFLLVVMAIAASRGGAVEPVGALTVLAAGLLFAVLALPAALIAAVTIWRTGRPGIGPALGGTALALALLAYPAWLAFSSAGLPPLSDVATTWSPPLAFSRAARAIAARHGLMHDPPTEVEQRQAQQAYPDVRPLTADLSAEDAYVEAFKLVKARCWLVLEAEPPAGKPEVGHIDAVAKSLAMGFPQDVTIRIAAVGSGQSRVDMRSASRFRQPDLGANAARITTFLADIESAAEDQ